MNLAQSGAEIDPAIQVRGWFPVQWRLDNKKKKNSNSSRSTRSCLRRCSQRVYSDNAFHVPHIPPLTAFYVLGITNNASEQNCSIGACVSHGHDSQHSVHCSASPGYTLFSALRPRPELCILGLKLQRLSEGVSCCFSVRDIWHNPCNRVDHSF